MRGLTISLSYFSITLFIKLQIYFSYYSLTFSSSQIKIMGSPFTEVTFVLVWLADQLNSLVTVILDIEYLICFYIFLIPPSWNIPQKRDICAPLVRPNATLVSPFVISISGSQKADIFFKKGFFQKWLGFFIRPVPQFVV